MGISSNYMMDILIIRECKVMKTTLYRRFMRLLPLTVALVAISTSSWAASFDQLLGNFHQRLSGVCVIYAHTLAIAESNPEGFSQQFTSVPKGWRVQLAGGNVAYVNRAEVKQSVENRFSGGDPENLLTVFSIAVSKSTGGYNYRTCMLDYGPKDYAQFIGSGKWALYDESAGPGKTLADGLDRLAKEARPDGSPAVPCTMGFGDLSRSSIPQVVELVKKYHLVGIHDFSVSRYDAATKEVLLRNPWNPQKLMAIPMDLLKRIPAGIDFMVKQ